MGCSQSCQGPERSNEGPFDCSNATDVQGAFDCTSNRVSEDAVRVRITQQGRQLDFESTMKLLVEDPVFRKVFNHILAESIVDAGFNAVYWECPAVNGQTAAQTGFEFVIKDCPELAGAQSDTTPFREYIEDGEPDSVAVFQNLDGQTTLVCPRIPNTGRQTMYPSHTHLAVFVKAQDHGRHLCLLYCSRSPILLVTPTNKQTNRQTSKVQLVWLFDSSGSLCKCTARQQSNMWEAVGREALAWMKRK